MHPNRPPVPMPAPYAAGHQMPVPAGQPMPYAASQPMPYAAGQPMPYAAGQPMPMPPGYPTVYPNLPTHPSGHLTSMPTHTVVSTSSGLSIPGGCAVPSKPSHHPDHHGHASGGNSSHSHHSKGNVGYVFQASNDELKHKKMEVEYSPSLDVYRRPTYDHQRDSYKTSGWRACAYDEKNIHNHRGRKRASLTLKPNADHGSIEWHFHVGNSSVKSVKVKFPVKTDHSGDVKIHLVTDKKKMEFKRDKDEQKFKDLGEHVHSFSIVCEIRCGKEDRAWKKAKLFRGELDDKDYPFQLKIKLHD